MDNISLLIQEPQVDRSELKLMLFPGQTLKIQALIGIMVHQRDILTRLQTQYPESNTPMSQSFTWKSQLQYALDEETRNVTVTVSSGV